MPSLQSGRPRRPEPDQRAGRAVICWLLLLLALPSAWAQDQFDPAGILNPGKQFPAVRVLGTIGWIGQPVDVISAPGATVAIALGIAVFNVGLNKNIGYVKCGDIPLLLGFYACRKQD